MRNTGNLQQQPLMQKNEPFTRRIFACLLAGGVLTTAACTRMPIEHSQSVSQRVNSGKMQVVAESSVGSTTGYIDSTSGATVEITVLSEYFSAGGRKCRRFLQGDGASLSSAGQGNGLNSDTSSAADNGVLLERSTKSDKATNRLACEDSKNGWIEIPIHSIAG